MISHRLAEVNPHTKREPIFRAPKSYNIIILSFVREERCQLWISDLVRLSVVFFTDFFGGRTTNQKGRSELSDSLQIFSLSSTLIPLGILLIVKTLLLVSKSAPLMFDTLM